MAHCLVDIIARFEGGIEPTDENLVKFGLSPANQAVICIQCQVGYSGRAGSGLRIVDEMSPRGYGKRDSGSGSGSGSASGGESLRTPVDRSEPQAG